MAVGLLPPGTLGNLTPDEERKLQESWVHLLRLCGVSTADASEVPDLSGELSHHLHAPHRAPGAFRAGLWGFVLAEHPDALVLRFLRARKWDVGRAMAMLVSAVDWRLEQRMAETVIGTGESVALRDEAERSADDRGFVAQYRSGKSYVHATDREGRLVYIIRVRLHDPRAQSSRAMETYTLHNIETLRIAIKPPNDKACLLFDMTGFGVKNMDFHVVKFLVTVFEARYPETLGVVLIHNAPFVFWGIWSIIKGWLDPVIAAKINFTRKPADLLRFISEENLQTSYGGKDSWEYEYVEPVAGENTRLDEVEKKAEIQGERDELIREFEKQTIEWSPKDPAAKEQVSRRNELAEQLSVNYWKLDPYIRARTYFHRVGMVGND